MPNEVKHLYAATFFNEEKGHECIAAIPPGLIPLMVTEEGDLPDLTNSVRRLASMTGETYVIKDFALSASVRQIKPEEDSGPAPDIHIFQA